MMRMGLSGNDLKVLKRTLLGHHAMRIRVNSHTLEGEWGEDLTDMVIDGQVTVDSTADVTRTASLTLLDPKQTLDFDSDSPSDVALFMDRIIKIHYGVRCEFDSGPEWVDIPIFTGPVTSLSRTGAEVSVEAQGKEALAMGACWRPLTLKAKRRKVSAIRIILRDRAGEQRFDLGNPPATLPKTISLHREDVPWLRARSIARSLGDRQLFYNGDGVCVLRRRPGTPLFTFDAESILSPIQVNYTLEDTVNCVFVKGGVPDGQKVQIAAEVFPPKNHPLSPWRLGRYGVPRYLMETVEDSHIRSLNEARRVARERLRQGLAQGVDASFDALPVPILEPGDMVRAVTDQGSVTFRLNSFAISLTAGEVMTVGYTRNLRTGRLPRARHLRIRGRTPEHTALLAAYRKQQQAKQEAAKKQPAHKANAAQPRKHHAGAQR